MKNTLRGLVLKLAVMAFAGTAMAEDLPVPEGPVILTVSGEISHTNIGGTAQFDLDMIEALPQRLTLTETPWYDGVQEFSGPLLSDLMASVGAKGQELRIIAVNDYAASMPLEEAQSIPVILAVRHGGALMSVRDKGPLFVIYPFDEHPDLNNELVFSRSVWQVVEIEVMP
ncbi:hypothetical protein [Rhabdonatronobacter sediminivivens]|nr:hypothetical protein [Rhabdonatronobacter sediminivivens]